MKKVLSLILALLLILSLLAACGSTPSTNDAEQGYKIVDYYKSDGSFSALGLALDENNAEKTLTVAAGNTLIVGKRQFKVTAESINLSFYTQNTFDAVIEWWTDYCESRIERGEIIELK